MNEQIICNPANLITSRGVFNGDYPLNFSFPLLAVQLILVFATTRLFCFLLKPLKQPRFVSEVISGIILGPSVLGRNETFRNAFFPARGTPVLDTVAMFGIMYVIFIVGVKVDPTLIKRTGQKTLAIGVISLLLPCIIVILLFFLLKEVISRDIKTGIFVLFLSYVISMTSFTVLVPVLYDLNLLNSELGRTSMSSSITNDIAGWMAMSVFIIMQATWISKANAVWALFSLASLVVFVVFIVRPISIWIIDRTPAGEKVEEGYVFMIIVGVSVIGFFSDMIGANSFNGALVMGLAIPDGPPLGAALVDKVDCVSSGLFLPLFYVMSGLKTDVYAINDGKSGGILVIVIMISCLGKFMGVLLPSLYYNMRLREAISLSLFMNVKGIAHVVIFNFWKDTHLLSDQAFAILTISLVVITAVVTPIVTIIYKPSKSYVVYKRRTIQHTKPDAELRILACLHHKSNALGILNLLEATYVSHKNPLCIFSVHLVQLIGGAAPRLLSHGSRRRSTAQRVSADNEPIVNAFREYADKHQGHVTLHPFTAVSPYATVHDEICHLAVNKRVVLIIMPLRSEGIASSQIRNINHNVLVAAPCSVGILIDRPGGNEFLHRICVLFFGGDDDREVLAYGVRMGGHHEVCLTVVRFIGRGGDSRENVMEKELDDEVIEEFKSKNLSLDNENRYRESCVRDLAETTSIMKMIISEGYDLLIVGMRHEQLPFLKGGLNEWSDWPEIGVIANILVSPEFPESPSILVLKQQDRLGLSCPLDSTKLLPSANHESAAQSQSRTVSMNSERGKGYGRMMQIDTALRESSARDVFF